MRRRLWASIMAVVLLAVPRIAHTQQAPDPRVADLVRAGKVRIALFSGQYTKDPVTGELKGVWADVARAFAVAVSLATWASRCRARASPSCRRRHTQRSSRGRICSMSCSSRS